MKRYWIGVIAGACVFALAALTGCDTTIGHSENDTPPALASVRSVTQDPVNDCTIEGVHGHSGVYYSGHYNRDGHDHSEHHLQADEGCVYSNCQETGLHQHNGTHYAGHQGADGHHGQHDQKRRAKR